MSTKLVLFQINIILILILEIISIDGTSSSLKLIQIIQRHGDRTPTNFYPNDEHKDPINWPDGIGELTRTGKTRMFEFGLTIRNKYQQYLGDSPHEVIVRSSGLTRTLESAQCFISGLYPPNGFWIWNNNSQIKSSLLAKNWQPIAVNTVLAANDGLLRTSAICPKADRLWDQFMQTTEVLKYLNKNKEFIQYLSTKTGDEYWNVKPSPLRPLEFLSTTLRVERENGLKMPEWADNKTLTQLRDLEIHAFYFDWKSPEIQRLRAGLLLKELTQNMLNRADEIVNKTKNNVKNLYVYETHDVNQVVLMQALNVYDSEEVKITPPTYTASLIFELHQKDNNTFVVKLLYFKDVKEYNTSIDDLVELQLVDCNPKSECTLQMFIKSVDNLIPNDWELECERISIQNTYTYFNLFSFVYIVSTLVVTIAFVSIIRYLCKKQKSQTEERNALDICYAKKYNQ